MISTHSNPPITGHHSMGSRGNPETQLRNIRVNNHLRKKANLELVYIAQQCDPLCVVIRRQVLYW